MKDKKNIIIMILSILLVSIFVTTNKLVIRNYQLRLNEQASLYNYKKNIERLEEIHQSEIDLYETFYEDLYELQSDNRLLEYQLDVTRTNYANELLHLREIIQLQLELTQVQAEKDLLEAILQNIEQRYGLYVGIGE